MNNLLLIRMVTIFEFIFLSIFYYKVIKVNSLKKYYYVAFSLLLLISSYDIYKNGFFSSDSITVTYTFILLIIQSLATFYMLTQRLTHLNITCSPIFWVNTGVLIYFSGTFFLFLFNDYILKFYPKVQIQLWIINSIVNVFYNTFFSIGYWKLRKQPI